MSERFRVRWTRTAQFRIHDGYCVYGPCVGMSLQRVGVEVSDGAVTALYTD